MATILIAETDPRTLDVFPRSLSERPPNVAVDVCTSTEELRRNRKLSTYDTIAISPTLLQSYQVKKFKAESRLLTPLLLTTNLVDRELAAEYLEHDAFDLIVKPIAPDEAAETVKLALWQSGLLKLLASKERAIERFREHMETFPHARKMEEEFASKMAAYARTLQAITTSLGHLVSREEENSLFDIAGLLESMTRKGALDRLLLMSANAPTH